MYDLSHAPIAINKPLHIVDDGGRILIIVEDNSLIFPDCKKVTPCQVKIYDQTGRQVGCHITFEIHFKDTDE